MKKKDSGCHLGLSFRCRIECWGALLFAFMMSACDGDSSSNAESLGVSSSDSEINSSAAFSSDSEDAKSSAGNNASEHVEGTLTDSRDGKSYRTVKIGSQIWMAENLNYETPNSYCYNDSAWYCSKYGRLYTWDAARYACPQGWSLPNKVDFETLFSAVGEQSSAGAMLKSTSGWSWNVFNDEDGNGVDAFSFSALPAGCRLSNNFVAEGLHANFWSNTLYADSRYDAYNMCLDYRSAAAGLCIHDVYDSYPVRCIKNW